MDLPLYLAVVVGAVLRRASSSVASGGGVFSSVFANGKLKYPGAVNARVQNLEVGFERLDENQRRYSREVSRLGTRVRLTRRELSPMIRRAEATSVKFGEVAAELARRIEVAEEEGSKLAETMASLHAVSAKQFEVLSKSVRELRAAMKQLELEADEVAIMSSEEGAYSSRRAANLGSRYAKKEELEKLELMLTEALEEMEDCLTTMVREKAVALGEEIDDISLMKDEEETEEEEKEDDKELVWVGETVQSSAPVPSSTNVKSFSPSPSSAPVAAGENENGQDASRPTIQLYKFDDFDDDENENDDDDDASVSEQQR